MRPHGHIGRIHFPAIRLRWLMEWRASPTHGALAILLVASLRPSLLPATVPLVLSSVTEPTLSSSKSVINSHSRGLGLPLPIHSLLSSTLPPVAPLHCALLPDSALVGNQSCILSPSSCLLLALSPIGLHFVPSALSSLSCSRRRRHRCCCR